MNNYKKFYDGLFLWHQNNKIAFPWQNRNDPYYAFVAGYCAQQTQIARVITIWKSLIKTFPTISNVEPSIPISSNILLNIFLKWRFNAKNTRARSSAGEHCIDIAGVTGSIPVVPTIFLR